MPMTLKEAKDKAIKLIDEYSINGKVVSEQQNKDYYLKMSSLADMAQKEIALYRGIPSVYIIEQAETPDLKTNEKARYEMPNDFRKLIKLTIEDTDQYAFEVMQGYFWQKPRTLIIDKRYVGTIRVEYYKYPSRITSETPDTYEFEIDDEAVNLVIYYMAYHLKLAEDPNLATQFLSSYNTGLQNLEEDKNQGMETITNLYNW